MSGQDVLVDTVGAIVFVGSVITLRKLFKNKRQKALF